MTANPSAIFLDRDGVIVQNRPDYILARDDVEFIPGALDALCSLHERDLKVFIVTNQSAIGRGLVRAERIRKINQQIIEVISAHGGKITGAYICPHAPHENCNCRKPQPGLVLQAREEHQIDLAHSILIGDAVSDLQAGHAAGIRRLALVRTGRGANQEALLEGLDFSTEIYDDLQSALDGMI